VVAQSGGGDPQSLLRVAVVANASWAIAATTTGQPISSPENGGGTERLTLREFEARDGGALQIGLGIGGF